MTHYYVNQTGLALSLQEYNMVQTVQLAMDRKQSVEISYQTLSQKMFQHFCWIRMKSFIIKMRIM